MVVNAQRGNTILKLHSTTCIAFAFNRLVYLLPLRSVLVVQLAPPGAPIQRGILHRAFRTKGGGVDQECDVIIHAADVIGRHQHQHRAYVYTALPLFPGI